MLKNITIKSDDGKDVQIPMRSDASIPRLYRMKFKRDILVDIGRLADKFQNAKTQSAQIAAMGPADLEMFEDLAYMFAKHADPKVPEDPNEWLEQFATFSIYEIFPQIQDLWAENAKVTSIPKKKSGQRSGK